MKKAFLSLSLALMTVLAMNAESYTGPIVVNAMGTTRTETVTVTATENDNGLYTLVLEVPLFGTMTMNDVTAAQCDGVTVYSAERYVYSATYQRNLRTIVFARSANGMMAANVTLPDQGATMWFNTVGNYFQLPNSDMESWTNSDGEPDRWHGFKTATGVWAFASPAQLGQSTDVHSGTTGQYSAVMTAKSLGVVANGTMTNGRLNAGSMSATDSTNNYAASNQSFGNDYYMPLQAKPDQFKVWLKFKEGTPGAGNKAKVSVKTFDGTYYQEPAPAGMTYTNVSGSIVGGQVAACDWTQFTFPMDYERYASNNAETKAIFVTFSTNANPGQGSNNDQLFVDDMELVYLGAITDLRYKGETLQGWDPAVTEYSIETAGEPNLDDFTATVEGASAVMTKSMEQNADGSYRIAISVVSGDLQNGTCYIINATAVPAIKKGDMNKDGIIDVSDVTALIACVLSNTGADEYQLAAGDFNDDHNLDVSDVTALISLVLNNNH